ncbi:MAG: hypothetical protein QM811_16085 [Pirellulales bacterium]
MSKTAPPTSTKPLPLVPLGDLQPGQEADFYALLAHKELLTTRDNKPYYKVAFRDAVREVAFPLWADTAHFVECRESWHVGTHYKLRAPLSRNQLRSATRNPQNP